MKATRNSGVLTGAAFLAAVLGLAACVSLEEAPLPGEAVRPDQRTVLLVFLSPAAWVTQEEESKAESAAKLLPGVGQIMQSVQDDQDLKASHEFRQQYPGWPGAPLLESALAESLRKAGYPGILTVSKDSGVPAPILQRLNKAMDILEWRRRYLTAVPLSAGNLRDYSSVMEFDGCLVLEVNLQYGLMHNAEGNVMPALASVSRLYRANTMKLMWSKDAVAVDRVEPRNIYDYKVSPGSLSEKLDKLAPQLAETIAGALRTALPAAQPVGAPGETPPQGGPARIPGGPGTEPTAPRAGHAPAPAPGRGSGGSKSIASLPEQNEPAPARQAETPPLPPSATAQAEARPLPPPATGQAETPAPAP